LLDGIPGNPENPKNTQIILNKNDGILSALETGKENFDESSEKLISKYSLGIWYYSSEFEDLTETDSEGNFKKIKNNFGIYGFAEKEIFKNVNTFLRAGWANPNINNVNYYFSAGTVFSNLFAENDNLGIAFATGILSSKFKKSVSEEGFLPRNHETNIELTYSFNVFTWLRIQPDFQYFINPVYNSSSKNFASAGVRFETSF